MRSGAVAVFLASASFAYAQDGGSDVAAGAPKAGAPATEADYDVLRKLLGVKAPPKRQPEPEPVAAPPAPPAISPTPTPAVVAPAPAAKPPAPVPVKAAPKAAPPKKTPVPVAPAKPAAPKKALPKPAPAKQAPPAVTATPKPAPVAPPAPAPVIEEVVAPQQAADGTGSQEAAEAAVPQDAAAPAPAFISPDVPPPGTVVSASNLERWKDFISPSIAWAVRRGAELPVVANEPIEMEPARTEATQRYSPQVRLSEDKNYMVNYVAGVPFPFVQTDDPDAGIKMILNWDNRIVNDDFDIRNFGCKTGSFGSNTGLQIERDYLTGHFRRLYYVSRLYNEPTPTWPNPEGIRYREMLHPVIEPFDLKGAGFTYNRFQNPQRQDDSWLYFPQTKRVRRLSTAQRSEGVFGQDIDLDSYGGYGGNPSWTSWRLLGTKTVIASMNARHMPSKWLPPPNDFLHDDDWQPRDVWVLEGRSRLSGYAFGSRVIYIDRETFLIPYTEIFDLDGRLWKALVQNWAVRDKMRPDSQYGVGYRRVVLASTELFDMQLNHATRCQFPHEDFAGKEDGWYLNVGDREGTTESVFDVASIIGEGR